MFTWNPSGYADAFLIGGAEPIRLSLAAYKAAQAAGVPHVADDPDKAMLHDVLVASRQTESDLTPI